MADRKCRDELISLIRRFWSRQLTNDEFEDSVRRLQPSVPSFDPAIDAVEDS